MSIVHHRTVAGSTVTITEAREPEDAAAFWAWYVGTAGRRLAVDTETTGLGIYSPGWALRLVQVGTAEEAWTLRPDVPAHREAIQDVLGRAPLVMHNATYDALSLDRAGLADAAYLLSGRTLDTRLLAHLLDPRAQMEGGTGHGLKDLADLFVDAEASSLGEAALMATFRANKWTKASGWAAIPVTAPEYVTYAGLDVILTSRLAAVLEPQVAARGFTRLATFEHEVQRACALMERTGLRVDPEYLAGLVGFYEAEEAAGVKDAAAFGITNVNSTAQVATALEATGAHLVEKTPSGKPKVDKAVLTALTEAGNPVAAAVQRAKRASKWMTAYVLPMLEDRDENDRIHPSINSLQARTARQSVARPPLQQLPSGDWRIRRAIVPDAGHALWSADYDQVEMRVLAALAEEPAMLRAIREGVDLHDFTASVLFGPGFTKAQRKVAKNTGFGKVYGGGKATLARQAGISLDQAADAVAAYDRSFPGIRRFQKRLESRVYATGLREVVTPSGRVLPLDGDRLYSATNYVVQSTSRDVLCQAILDLQEAGLEPGRDLLLPIHDEILGQTTPEAWEALKATVDATMTMDFLGKVTLTAAADLIGPSWGHAYGAPG